MRNLKKYFDAIRLMSGVPSEVIHKAASNVLHDSNANPMDAKTASVADVALVANLLRTIIDIAKADEAAAERAGKADKP